MAKPDADRLRERLIADTEVGDIHLRFYKTHPKVVAEWRETTTRRAEGDSIVEVLRAIVARRDPDFTDADTQPIPKVEADPNVTQPIKVKKEKK